MSQNRKHKPLKKVFLSIGGNLGDRLNNLAQAIQYIEAEIGPVLALSKIYETKAWGVPDQPDFLNQVLLVNSMLSPTLVLTKALAIEKKMGRIRERKWFTRIIDIDILFYEQEMIDLSQLKIPHPQIANRNFVLVPLMDIAPDWIHPTFQKTTKQLLEECLDDLPVIVLEPKTRKG